MKCVVVLTTFLSLLLSSAPAMSQSYQSSGVVHDTTGGVIPGAAVDLRQSSDGPSWSTRTDEQGAFKVALPDLGTYEVEISASGFALYRTEIILTPGAPSSNLDISLAVEGNSQTIEVTANALAAETTSTQLGESLDNGQDRGSAAQRAKLY